MKIRKGKVKVEKVEEIPVKRTSHISFSFEFLHDASYTECKDSSFFIDFLQRLKSLCLLDWNEICRSHRHSFGYEKIPVEFIKKSLLLTGEVNYLYSFRATGDNHAFLGFREGDVFKILFIEAAFGDIYNHGKK